MDASPATQSTPTTPSEAPTSSGLANPSDVSEFSRMAPRHLTLVVGRVQLLRRAARRGAVDHAECVGRLDDIDLSVHRLTMLVASLERSVEPGEPPEPSAPGSDSPPPPPRHTQE